MRALLLNEVDNVVSMAVAEREPPSGDVVIAGAFSALNYKDWMVAQPRSRVRRVAQLVPGVEIAGRVERSDDPSVAVGDEVIAYGGPFGVRDDGGFAESAGCAARYVTVLPSTMSSRRAMTFGLAGYTAMASVLALEHHGLPTSGGGDVLVTGASGGVGSLAVTFLARRGHRPVAATGSPDHAEWLRSLGAVDVVGRDAIDDAPDRVLGSKRWAGAIDCVGGDTLRRILRSLRYGAAVAASGLVGGADLATTVYPFITRNVSLLGIDAVETPRSSRDVVWKTLAETATEHDDALVEREVTLDDVPHGLEIIGRGGTRGRWLVNLSPNS